MDIKAELREAGLKVTYPRMKVLKILCTPGNEHISAEDVHIILIKDGEEISLATVYRVLNQFTDSGLTERHHFETGKAVYELQRSQHHDHLICVKSGQVYEFRDEIIESRQKEIAAEHGMKLSRHSLYLYGEPED